MEELEYQPIIVNQTVGIDFGQKIYSFDKYDIYCITNVYKFLKDVKIWKGLRTKNGVYSTMNREVNELKVDEIFESIMNDTLAPSVIHISEIYDTNEKKTILRCWEGQHRWHALKKFYRMKHNKNINHLFTCNIYKNDTDDNIKIKFKNFNKLTPVPVDDDDDTEIKLKRIELVKYIIDYIKKTWSELQSTSNNPHKPNYNIDNLYNQLNDYIKDYKLENICYQYFENKINEHNEKLKNHYDNKYKNKVPPNYIIKAIQSNCFLFIEKDFTISMEMSD
jgi:hypothetical protein